MMATINEHLIAGYVQAGGEVRTFEGGSSRAQFRVMTQSFKSSSDGSSVRTADFHNVQVWNNVFDDLYELVKEGGYVIVRGPARAFEYPNKKMHGQMAVFLYIKAEFASLVGRDIRV